MGRKKQKRTGRSEAIAKIKRKESSDKERIKICKDLKRMKSDKYYQLKSNYDDISSKIKNTEFDLEGTFKGNKIIEHKLENLKIEKEKIEKELLLIEQEKEIKNVNDM